MINNADKNKDTGLALLLISLIVLIFNKNLSAVLYIALVICIALMTKPSVFKPLAPLWFGFSHLLGTIVSTVIYTLLYAVVLAPVGLSRKLMGKDSLNLKSFKKGKGSVFINREQIIVPANLEKPY